MSSQRKALQLLALLTITSLAPAIGLSQTIEPDGEGELVLPGGSNIQINEFGECLSISNSSQTTYAYEFASQAEWNTWVTTPPDPGVTYSACTGSTTCPNQTVTWTVNGVSCAAAFSKKGNGNTEALTATAGSNGSAGNGAATATCNNGVVTLSGQTCSASAPPPPSGCTDGNGNPVADGGTWTTSGPTTEACFLINSAYTGGTANCTQTNTWLCNNGSAQLQGKSNSCDTSTCTNSAGGHCVPLTQTDCNNTSVYPPDPLDEWTAAHSGLGGALGAQVCYTAYEYAAHLVYTLSSDECSCQSSVHVDNEINSETVDCAAPPNSTPPAYLEPPNCPNVQSTCIP
jgi:hypothetical protein